MVEIDPPKHDEPEDDIIDEKDAQKAKGGSRISYQYFNENPSSLK